MAQFTVKSPDGVTYSVNAPEGATEADAIAYVQKNLAPTDNPQAMSRMEKIAQGAIDPINGSAQLLTHVLPDSVVNAGNQFNNWLSDKTGLVAKLPAGGVDQQVKQQEQAYQAKRAAAGESGFDGYRAIGNVLSPTNLALAAKIPQAATLAGKIGLGAASGGVSGLTAPVTGPGNFSDEKALQLATGSAVGGAVPILGAGLSRFISPNASTNPALQLLKAEGVKPTIGQSLGGWANRAEEAFQSLPIMGDAISAARNNAKQQFNSAAINRATAPIGVEVKGSGTHAVAEAGDAISKVYEQAKSALGGFKIDQQAQSELSQLRMMATTGLEGRERNTVNSYFNDYLKKPSLTAESFKQLDSKLNSDIARFGNGDAYQKQVADALKEVQRIVTDNAKRENPQAAELFKKADAAWANLVRVEGASVGAKATEGVFTPGQLLSAVRQSDKSTRDRATARGTALMQDLASAGQRVLGNKLPNSGTADRLMLGAGGLGAYFVNPAIPVGLTAGAAAYWHPAQTLLRGMATTRPDLAKPVAKAVYEASPLLAPGAAQFVGGLLK